jgi:Cu+-exporting ATPase
MNASQKTKIFLAAITAIVGLLFVYALVVSTISGYKFASEQFAAYWFYVVSLAVGFGIQVGFYMYLREAVHGAISGKTVAVTGTTSTLAMISCCAHYLVNILPILGVAGAVAIIAQYQIQLFWVGIVFNLFGIAFIIKKIIAFKKKT